MDTSETYIKMRLAAIPDLGMGCKPETDIMANAGRDLSLDSPLILRVETYKRISGDVWLDLKGGYYYDSDVGACQLERQDQLQEMVLQNTENREKLGSLLSRFWVFCSCFYLRRLTFEVFTSMEQLWLAFVMKEKYNKVWNGTDWIMEVE